MIINKYENNHLIFLLTKLVNNLNKILKKQIKIFVHGLENNKSDNNK